MKVGFLPLFFASGGAIAGGSFVIPEIFQFDNSVVMKVSGDSVSGVEGKEWVKIGAEDGEGIFIPTRGTYSIKGSWLSDSSLFGPARIGSKQGNNTVLADEDKPVMIWSGEKGIVVFRGKRFFKKSKDESTLKEAGEILSEVWNKGDSSKWGDEDPSYYCKARTEKWRELLNENVVVYAKHAKAADRSLFLGTITPIEKKKDNNKYKLTNKTFNTPCRGTEIFAPEKVSLLTKTSLGATTIDVKAQDKKLGYKFDIGEVKAVLYGRNKDLRVTEKGIEDSLGNRIDWGHILPAIKLVRA